MDEKLTREQASTMISRVYKKYKDENWKIAEDYSFELKSDAKFADDAEISDWAKNSVYFMNENEKMFKNKRFITRSRVRRAEFTQLNIFCYFICLLDRGHFTFFSEATPG